MSLTRKNALITILWSGLSTVQFFLKNIFFISLFLKYRTGQDYGFWIILMSFYGMTVYVCDGYVRYCLNEYNLEYHRDRELAARNFRNGFAFLLTISLVILALLFAFIHYLPLSVAAFNASPAIVEDHGLHYCLFIVMLVSLAHCMVKYISGAIEPDGNVHITNRYVAILGLSETAVYFLCVFLAFSFSGIFLVLLLVHACVNVIYLFSLFRKHSIYRQGVLGGVKKGFLIFLRSLFFIANNFFEKLTLDGVNFMIAIFYPPVALLPVYASTRAMANVMVTSSNTFISVFTVEYQRLSIIKETARLLKIFHAIWLLLGLGINFGLVLAYPLLTGLYTLWTRGKLPVDTAFFFVIFSLVLFNVYGTLIILYLKSLNSIKLLFPVSIFRALLIFTLIALLPRQPIYLALSLFASEFLVNVILLNGVLYREIRKMTGENILPALFWNVLPFVLTAIFLPLNSLLHLGYAISTIGMVSLLLITYIIQVRYMKNDLLATNLKLMLSNLRSPLSGRN